MGRASQRKKQHLNLSKEAKKVYKEMLKDSSPDVYVTEDDNGNKKATYYNPLKKILKGEKYTSEEGIASTVDMVKKYDQFLKTRLNIEKTAKQTGIDPDGVIKGDNEE